jgi:hypothetical protein
MRRQDVGRLLLPSIRSTRATRSTPPTCSSGHALRDALMCSFPRWSGRAVRLRQPSAPLRGAALMMSTGSCRCSTFSPVGYRGRGVRSPLGDRSASHAPAWRRQPAPSRSIALSLTGTDALRRTGSSARCRPDPRAGDARSSRPRVTLMRASLAGRKRMPGDAGVAWCRESPRTRCGQGCTKQIIRLGGEWIETRLLSSGRAPTPWFANAPCAASRR